jgi:hypothetical protein
MNSKDMPIIETVLSQRSYGEAAREYIERSIEEVVSSLPNPALLSAEERRGLIGRYTAVLEGNFIYWMTATYLSVRSDDGHAIIEDNLREEVRDNHPGMLRRFAVAARATSTDADRMVIDRDLQAVRAFVARLAALEIILMMAFFEGFIQRFMPYLAELAVRQGSTEREYTDVHSVVDIAHTQGLITAFESELSVTDGTVSASTLFQGIEVLRTLINTIIRP